MSASESTRAFDLLRERDPLSATDWQRLGDLAASRAHGVVAGVVGQPVVASGRARSLRRGRSARLAVALLILLLAVPLAATALGVGLPVVDFLGAEKAAPVAVENFKSLSVGAPEGMDPRAIAGEARELTLVSASGEKQTLWLAPTKAGGFCFLWAGVAGPGGCDRLGTVPLDVMWWSHAAAGIDGAGGSRVEGIAVHASARYVSTVELRFADGTVIRPSLTWVSAPISHGFLFYSFPSSAQAGPQNNLTSVVALDDEGKVVSEVPACCAAADEGLPADALVAERRAAASTSTAAGEATIWEAPTRYGGTCAWLELGGHALSPGACSAAGYGADHGITLRAYPTAETVLVFGRAAPRFRAFDVRYADGTTQRIQVHNGYLLFEIPSGHRQPASRLLTLTAVDEDGQPSATFTFPATAQPCWRALPLERGTSC
jgi:hypothetical protein